MCGLGGGRCLYLFGAINICIFKKSLSGYLNQEEDHIFISFPKWMHLIFFSLNPSRHLIGHPLPRYRFFIHGAIHSSEPCMRGCIVETRWCKARSEQSSFNIYNLNQRGSKKNYNINKNLRCLNVLFYSSLSLLFTTQSSLIYEG